MPTTGRPPSSGAPADAGIHDNMKTAVESVFVGKDRAYNRRFLQMCGHYLVEPVACTPASGWENRIILDKSWGQRRQGQIWSRLRNAAAAKAKKESGIWDRPSPTRRALAA